ncbi:MAG: IS607 family transposase [Candidatus Lokiarchaeota archaeon]|nr:IS607 family transposase [Candidatus Lokiarchaeota archaeon]
MNPGQLLKIGDVATLLGVTTQTLRNWTNSGYMNTLIGKGGHRRFRRSEVERLMELKEREDNIKKCLLYYRVSSSIQKDNLECQLERLTSFALSNGFIIEGIYKDIVSGMNFKRRGLLKLLKYCQKQRISTVIIEYKDRLARFGVDLLREFLSSFGTELLIVNATNSNYKQEIIDDMIAIIIHFSSRLYGKRKGRNKANKIKKELLKET